MHDMGDQMQGGEGQFEIGDKATVAVRVEKEVRNMCIESQEKKQTEIKQSDLMRLVESQNYRCALSSIELTPETAALDHITPVANGGAHAIENLQWLNSEVNRMKGMLSVDVFIDICRRVAATAEGQQSHTPTPR